MTHRLLARQLKKLGFNLDNAPQNGEDWHSFLQQIERTYHDADQDRYLLERSMTISSDELRATNEQLRQISEYRISLERNRFHNVISSIPDGVCALNASGATVLMNPVAESLLGWSESELNDVLLLDKLLEPADRLAAGILAHEQLLEQLQTGRLFNLPQIMLKRKDESKFPARLQISPIISDKELQGIVLMFQNIAIELRQEEFAKKRTDLLETLNYLARQSFHSDISPLLQKILQLTTDALEASSSYILDWDQETADATVITEYFAEHATVDETHILLGESFQHKKEFSDADWVNSPNLHFITHIDDPQMPEQIHLRLQQRGVQTSLEMPLVVQGEVLGFINIMDSRYKRQFLPEEIELVQIVARQLATLSFNINIFNSIQENLEFQKALFENANYAVIAVSPTGIIQTFNSAAERMLGYQSGALVGREPLTLFFCPDELKSEAERLSKRLGYQISPTFELLALKAQSEQDKQAEWHFVDKEGNRFWADVSISELKTNEGNVSGYLAIASDISERRKAEAKLEQQQTALEKLAADLQKLFMVANNVAGKGDYRAMLDASIELLEEEYNLQSQIYILNVFGDSLMLTASSNTQDKETLANDQIAFGMKEDDNPIVQVGQTQKSVVIPNYDEAAAVPHPIFPESRSQAIIPMAVGENLFGVLELNSSTPNFFIEGQNQAFQMLAAHLAVLLQNARSLEKAEEAAQELDVVSRRLVREGWQEHFDSQERDLFGYQYNLEAISPLTYEETIPYSNGGDGLAKSLTVMGEEIGSIALDTPTKMTEDGALVLESVAEQLSAHLENLRLTEQTEQALKVTESLYNIGLSLTAVDDLNSILKAVVSEQIASNVSSATLNILERNQTTDESQIVVASNWVDDGLSSDAVLPIGAKFSFDKYTLNRQWLENPGEPLIISDTQADELVDDASKELLHEIGARGHVIVPLQAQNQVVGSISYFWQTPRYFSDREEQVFRALITQVGAVLQNQNLFAQTEEALQETAALYQISARLNAANSAQEVVEAMGSPGNFSNWNATSLMGLIVDDENVPQTAIVEEVYTHQKGKLPIGKAINLQSSPFADIWINNPDDAVLCGDVLTDERLDEPTRQMLAKNSGRALVTFPLKQQNEWLGLLTITWQDPQRFDESDRRFFTALARQATIALSNHKLLQQTEERANQMATVSDVSTAASTILEPDTLLQTVVDLTKERFGLYHAHIYTVEGDELVLKAGAGKVGRQMLEEGWRIPMFHKSSIVARSARERAGIIENDVQETPNFLPNPNLPDTRSELAAPMIAGESLIGILDVQSDKIQDFTDQDVLIQTTLATQVAIALQNAELYLEQLKTAEKLREVDRLKSEFLARMSHELRTPLNSIIGFSDILLEGLDGELNERMEEDVTVIRDSGKHLRELIGDILDLAKIESGMMTLSYQEVEVASMCDEALATTMALAMQKQLELTTEVPEEMPAIQIDRTRIKQVLINLIGNAIKFTRKGGVTLSVKDEGDMAYFAVTDTGIGISEEDMTMVFEEFRQVDGGLTRDSGGTGLGVPISKHLVELHGGEMGAESVLGEGATFWFKIPKQPPPKEETESAEDES